MPGRAAGRVGVEIRRPTMHSNGEFNMSNETSLPRAFEDLANGRGQSQAGSTVPGDVCLASPAKAWARALEITAQATRDPARNLAAGCRRMGGQVWRRRGASERPGALELQGA